MELPEAGLFGKMLEGNLTHLEVEHLEASLLGGGSPLVVQHWPRRDTPRAPAYQIPTLMPGAHIYPYRMAIFTIWISHKKIVYIFQFMILCAIWMLFDRSHLVYYTKILKSEK